MSQMRPVPTRPSYDSQVPTSRRLRYQRVSRHDIETFHTLCLDAHVRQYLLDGTEVTRAWAADAIELSERLFESEGVGLWIVRCNEAPIGFCGFRVFPQLGAEPQLLYAVTGADVEAGYATEAAETMVAETLRLGWPRMTAAVDRPNVASIRVLENVGFAACGRVPGRGAETLLFERFEMAPPPRLSAPVGTRWTLTIQRTWDGKSVTKDEAVAVALELGQTDLALRIDAPFHGDPPPDSDDLWMHEVVELMVVGADETYLEVELSPHGQHLVLFLSGERHVVHRGVALDYRVDVADGRWRGVASIPVGWLPNRADRLNAFAVHGTGHQRRYLAWRPTHGPRPDFHRLAEFGSFSECVVDPDR